MLEFVAGQRGQPGRGRVVGGFGDREHDEERQREHGQGGPPIPGAPAADLMLIQATPAGAGLERLLDPPAASGDADQDGQRGGPRHPAAAEGQLAGGAVAAEKQPVLAGAVSGVAVAVVELDERPVVER
jgi:hypothetical protein